MLKMVDIPKSFYYDVMEMAGYCRCSFVKVITKALGIMKLVIRIQREGGKVFIKNKDGNVEELLNVREE
jgi:hypothetical protein